MSREDLPVSEPAPPLPTTQLQSRRALLAGTVGGIGALAASVIGGASRVEAASGDPLTLGSSNSAGTANTSLTTSSSGTALLVTQNGSGTALRGSAVGPGSIAGFFTAQNGTGVSGVTGNPNSYGVFAQNNGAAGTGGALRASGGNSHGVVGSSANVNTYGVLGINTAVNGDGVAGSAGAGGTGVIGFSTGGNGVYGSSDTFGVRGNTTGGTAVKGEATTGIGVYGVSTDDIGVLGASTNGQGVYGSSTNGDAGAFSGPVSMTKHLQMLEISEPATPVANSAKIFLRDSGGKTQVVAKFSDGSIVVMAAQP
jgi:hypothetical protein